MGIRVAHPARDAAMSESTILRGCANIDASCAEPHEIVCRPRSPASLCVPKARCGARRSDGRAVRGRDLRSVRIAWPPTAPCAGWPLHGTPGRHAAAMPPRGATRRKRLGAPVTRMMQLRGAGGRVGRLNVHALTGWARRGWKSARTSAAPAALLGVAPMQVGSAKRGRV
jgi:hypothetical protein